MSLCFSPSGRMLLVTSSDHSASIWNIPTGTTWPSTPRVTLKGHMEGVTGGAFLGDESHVITGSDDKSLRIWRTSDGVQTAKYPCAFVRHALSIYIAHPFCYSGVSIVVSRCVWQHCNWFWSRECSIGANYPLYCTLCRPSYSPSHPTMCPPAAGTGTSTFERDRRINEQCRFQFTSANVT